MKKLIVLLSLLTLAGCDPNETYWANKTVCLTDAQREKAATLTSTFLAATPKSIGGDDQDWEDAINAAAYRAIDISCPEVSVEYNRNTHRETGRIRQLEVVNLSQPIGAK